MKKIFNKNAALAALFLCFVFVVLGGTCYNVYKEKARYISAYADCLGAGTGTLAKTKAATLTLYNALVNVNDSVFAKNGFINVYGFSQKATGNRCVYEQDGKVNKVVKMDDASITFVMNKNNNLAQQAAKTSTLNKKLKSEGVDLLYVQLPFKINKFEKGLPTGVEDYSNENADEILASLIDRDVATFDLRNEIAKEFSAYASLFFKTDHHWKPETGLWAAHKIADKLNSDYGFNMDTSLFEKDRFALTTYKDHFLGSMGKRMGIYYAGRDDFSLLLPRDETDMSCHYKRANGKTFGKSGSFEDTWIFHEHLKKDYFESNTYVTYSGGDFPLMIFHNNRIEDKKILVLRDSYSCVVIPFLSLAACAEMHIIDPRMYKGSITEYIDNIKPDVVLMLYNPSILNTDCFFDFQKNNR
ncbi:MAG TPA: DHHW family protein [Clostridia bacterium]|nr:DHHW family protein [Clostridia bacterium]